MIVTLALLAVYISLSLPWIGHPLKHALGHLIGHVFVHLGEHHPAVLIVLSWSAVLSIPALLLLGFYWSAGSVFLILRLVFVCLDPGNPDPHFYSSIPIRKQGRGDT